MALTLMSAAGKFYEHAAFHQHELCHQVLLLFIIISLLSFLFVSFSAFYPSCSISIEISLSHWLPQEKEQIFMHVCFITSFSLLALSTLVMLILCQKYILLGATPPAVGEGHARWKRGSTVINSLTNIVNALILCCHSVWYSRFHSINNTLQLNPQSVKLSKINCILWAWNIAHIDLIANTCNISPLFVHWIF